jgi:hypothetical protein
MVTFGHMPEPDTPAFRARVTLVIFAEIRLCSLAAFL